MKIILKILLKLIVFIVQIPLTIAYFVIGIVGSLLKGAGWLTGIILFAIRADIS